MGSSSNARTGSSYDATVAHLRRVLGGFAPDYGDAQRSEQEYVLKVPPSKLPVAVLAREVMVVFGAADLGAEDKVAWCYGFTVDGVPCTLASTKWGLRLHLDAAVGDADAAGHLAQRVLDKLAAAQRVVNKSVLSPQLDGQIKAGNVTITNQYATLRGSYEYFREGAEQAYAGAGRLANHRGLGRPDRRARSPGRLVEHPRDGVGLLLDARARSHRLPAVHVVRPGNRGPESGSSGPSGTRR